MRTLAEFCAHLRAAARQDGRGSEIHRRHRHEIAALETRLAQLRDEDAAAESAEPSLFGAEDGPKVFTAGGSFLE